MRIWSFHPKYLDSKGLVALWRETLLAKNVLGGKTKGYKNHPQLIRFKESSSPLHSINFYLSEVHKEATSRNYRFDISKIGKFNLPQKINVTDKQVAYEWKHLSNKLKQRDIERFKKLIDLPKPFELHPLFTQVNGEIEGWEVVK